MPEIQNPRFIAFISRVDEIPAYKALAPQADFTFASYSKLGSETVQIDANRLDEAVDTFSRLQAAGRYSAILNRKEKCVVPAAVLASSLGLPPIMSDPELARDKLEMRRALNGGEIFPGTVLIRDAGDLSRVPARMFPCVLKPRFGFNSRSAVRVENPEDLASAYEEQHMRYSRLPKQDGTNDHFVVEDFISGTEHNVESLLKDGRAAFHLISDKVSMQPPFFIEVGDNMPSALPASGQKACRDAAEKAIKALGIRNGWTHTEVKLNGNKAVVIESAARMGGGYFEDLTNAVFGINRMGVLIGMFLGNEPTQAPECRVHAAARRLVVYGAQRMRILGNPEILTRDSRVKLVWPYNIDDISRSLAGPPFDFNNTLFEFIALGESSREASELANAIVREARVMESEE